MRDDNGDLLFPNRRYIVAGGERHIEREPAEAEARALSRAAPDAVVTVQVIEEAEPVGRLIVRNGRVATEGDAR